MTNFFYSHCDSTWTDSTITSQPLLYLLWSNWSQFFKHLLVFVWPQSLARADAILNIHSFFNGNSHKRNLSVFKTVAFICHPFFWNYSRFQKDCLLVWPLRSLWSSLLFSSHSRGRVKMGFIVSVCITFAYSWRQ